jgi:hypothetical protein
MAADVEQETLVLDGPADAADRCRILLKHDDPLAALTQQIAGCQSGRPGANNQNVVRHWLPPQAL